MIKITMFIIGLGNPGKKYALTRHNAGAMFIDYLDTKYHDEARPRSAWLNTRYKIHDLFIAYRLSPNLTVFKLKTFMNESGKAVQKIIKNLELSGGARPGSDWKIRNLLVAHDDLDIPLGKFKIQKGVGPKLHNGIKSVEQYLHAKDFWRIRIGIDNRLPERRTDGERYTLQNFFPEEREQLKNVFKLIESRLNQSHPSDK